MNIFYLYEYPFLWSKLFLFKKKKLSAPTISASYLLIPRSFGFAIVNFIFSHRRYNIASIQTKKENSGLRLNFVHAYSIYHRICPMDIVQLIPEGYYTLRFSKHCLNDNIPQNYLSIRFGSEIFMQRMRMIYRII